MARHKFHCEENGALLTRVVYGPWLVLTPCDVNAGSNGVSRPLMPVSFANQAVKMTAL